MGAMAAMALLIIAKGQLEPATAQPTLVNSMNGLLSALANPSVASIRLATSGSPYCCQRVEISRSVRLEAEVAGADTISGGRQHRGYTGGGVMAISATANVTLDGLVIREGVSYAGGGIQNQGTLRMQNCIVEENRGDWNCYGGGGIRNLGVSARLMMQNCTLRNNVVSTGRQGGAGIWNNGIMELDTVTFESNTANGAYGSAIDNSDTSGNSILHSVTFTGNSGTTIRNSGVLVWQCEAGFTPPQTGSVSGSFTCTSAVTRTSTESTLVLRTRGIHRQ